MANGSDTESRSSCLAQSGGIPQVNDPRLRSRLISEVCDNSTMFFKFNFFN